MTRLLQVLAGAPHGGANFTEARVVAADRAFLATVAA